MRRHMRALVKNPAAWYTAVLILAWPVESLLSTDHLDRLMEWSSTNLANLHPSGHPLLALVVSAFVPQDSPGVWPVLALSLFTVMSTLGAWRGVAFLASVHIGVTLATEGLVWWRIHHGTLPLSEEHTLDTGPSYLVVAAMVVAIGRARPRWLRAVWAIALVLVAPSLLDGIDGGDYTAIGHVLAATSALAVVGVLRIREVRRIGYPVLSPQETA